MSAASEQATPLAAADLISIPVIGDRTWSHDDAWLYLSTNISDRFNIWKMSAQGGALLRNTRAEETLCGLVALPESQRLLFLQDHRGDEYCNSTETIIDPDEGRFFLKRKTQFNELARTLGWFDAYFKHTAASVAPRDDIRTHA